MIQGFINSFFNPNKSQFNENQRLQKLRNQLMTCTYFNNIKFLIERICMDVMRTYPAFNTEILAFIQNNQPRRFIEIGGPMTYKYNKKQRTVKVFMMFNQFFPNKPPYVRVVNSEKKKVNYYYDIYESPNDKNSYVLNSKLNNLVSWAPGNRCQPIIEELRFLLETFPFYEDDVLQSQQKKEEKKKQPQNLKIPAQNQYIANRGSIYQSKIQEQKPQSKGTSNQDEYNQKQCKLCFSNQSTMINTSCGHIMMCQDCFKAYRKKCGSDICQCPICKAKGQYIRFVQPKYA